MINVHEYIDILQSRVHLDLESWTVRWCELVTKPSGPTKGASTIPFLLRLSFFSFTSSPPILTCFPSAVKTGGGPTIPFRRSFCSFCFCSTTVSFSWTILLAGQRVNVNVAEVWGFYNRRKVDPGDPDCERSPTLESHHSLRLPTASWV